MLNRIQYGLRQLFKHPGFTFVAVLTLALGIGAGFSRPMDSSQAMTLVAVSVVIGLDGLRCHPLVELTSFRGPRVGSAHVYHHRFTCLDGRLPRRVATRRPRFPCRSCRCVAG